MRNAVRSSMPLAEHINKTADDGTGPDGFDIALTGRAQPECSPCRAEFEADVAEVERGTP